MPAERSEFEHEIRDLVSRILDGVLDAAPESTGASGPTVEPVAARNGEHDSRVALGADHGGFALKEDLARKLTDAGWVVDDVGTHSTQACDYPDFAHAVARRAGIGSAMVANKVPGVRAAACYDLSTARNSREHNRANVLTLGAGLTGPALAWQIVQEWLATPWGGDRHLRRVALINEIEEIYARSEA